MLSASFISMIIYEVKEFDAVIIHFIVLPAAIIKVNTDIHKSVN